MSVMDEMKNVVTVGRELLSTVSGKMREIDDKVDEATASVPNTLRNMLDIQTFVDGISGDDKNSGELSSAPKKTLASALERGVSGCTHKIFLGEGQTYVVDKSISFNNQNLMLYNSGNAGTLSSRAVVYFKGSTDKTPFSWSLTQGSLTFYGLVIRHPAADGIIPESASEISNALIRSVGAIVALDYRYNLATTVEFGESPYSILVTADRALATLVLAVSEATGIAGKLVANRYGGAALIRVGAHSSDEGIEMYPAGADAVSFDYLIP
ncbi:hypothetical protein ACUN9V_05070 [Salinicola sp. V024]|uniref:hypothetical protein n=1 Tax=Salinicola sp. V024 TaxID=3459609 RepID=UPI0040447A7C